MTQVKGSTVRNRDPLDEAIAARANQEKQLARLLSCYQASLVAPELWSAVQSKAACFVAGIDGRRIVLAD